MKLATATFEISFLAISIVAHALSIRPSKYGTTGLMPSYTPPPEIGLQTLASMVSKLNGMEIFKGILVFLFL